AQFSTIVQRSTCAGFWVPRANPASGLVNDIEVLASNPLAVANVVCERAYDGFAMSFTVAIVGRPNVGNRRCSTGWLAGGWRWSMIAPASRGTGAKAPHGWAISTSK